MVSDWGDEEDIALGDAGDGVLESDLTSRVSEEAAIGEGDACRWTGFSFQV
jgi:hypothetical protein